MNKLSEAEKKLRKNKNIFNFNFDTLLDCFSLICFMLLIICLALLILKSLQLWGVVPSLHYGLDDGIYLKLV
jgi:hypothetical protein